MKHSARCLSRESLAPIFGAQPPTDFDRRHEWRLERWNHQPYEADEIRIDSVFDREETKSMTIEMIFNANNQRIGFLGREQSWHEFHHARIGIDPLKRQTIFLAPSP